jgi:hypothetical protein
MGDIVKRHGTPGFSVHGNRMNPTVMGIERPLAGAIKPQSA